MNNQLIYNYKKTQRITQMLGKPKISDLEKELIKAETNMGYFSISKGAEKLFAQVNEKNDKIKEEIELLKRKIKMIPNE